MRMRMPFFIPWKRRRSSASLPDEALLIIFDQAILASGDTLSTYELLLATARTNRQWRRVSNDLLFKHVELVKQEDADGFRATLRSDDGKGALVRTMAICSDMCSGAAESSIISEDTLYDLLALTPHLRQLTLLHVESGDDLEKDDTHTSLDNLSALTHLEDVTLAPAKGDLSPRAQLVIIGKLPSQIKHLQLPGPSPSESEELEYPPHPSFQLNSLRIQAYPTPWTNWLLQHSGTSLRALIVATLGDIQRLAENHPNLTSLTVLGNLAPHPAGLGLLKHLRNLDLACDLSDLPQGILETLPQSLRRLQIRCIKLGAVLGNHLHRLPLLNTITWDLSRRRIHGEGRADGLWDLQRACETQSIKLILVGWVRDLTTYCIDSLT